MRGLLVLLGLLAVLAAGGLIYLLVVAESMSPPDSARSIELDVDLRP